MRSARAGIAVGALLTSSIAAADLVDIQSNGGLSTEGLGAFTGSLSWTYLGGNNGQLTVTLTNTSSLANGGYLTAFMFRASNDDASLTSGLSSATDLDFLFIPVGETAPPFPGTYNGGAGLNGAFLGMGNPSAGLGVGATGTFVFSINSTAAASLTAASFVYGAYDFVVRFRGFEDDGSDKVPAELVPAPGAFALLGLAAVGAGRRRRRA